MDEQNGGIIGALRSIMQEQTLIHVKLLTIQEYLLKDSTKEQKDKFAEVEKENLKFIIEGLKEQFPNNYS